MEKLNHIVQKSITEKIFSGIGIEVKHKGSDVLSLYDGKIFLDDKSTGKDIPVVTNNHLFDLASLTKPLCTGLLTSILIDKGRFALNTKISEILDEYSLSYNKELKDVTIGQLLNHSSGLDAWQEIYSVVKTRSDAYMFVRSRTLDYKPAAKHVYSDLGYILLGEVVEIILEHKLDYLLNHFLTAPLELHNLCYVPINNEDLKKEKKFVSTGFSQIRNKVLIGETNDENTYIFKGIAGHAGLFGTASDVSCLAQYLLDSLNDKIKYPIISKQTLTKIFERNSDGSEWAYGWHYPTTNSTGGKLISKNSVGMTGFTGTSVWIDFDRDLIITILANRTVAVDSAKFGWDKDRFTDIRPLLHDIIIGELVG